MGCATCGTASTQNGKPAGCRGNGGCDSGGCNKLNTFNWLAEVPVSLDDAFDIYEISFKNGSRKGFFRNKSGQVLTTGEVVVVDATNGYDLGQISLSGELVRLQMRKKEVRTDSSEIFNILRVATENDLRLWDEARALEKETMFQARVIARHLNLDMKIGDVEYQGDKKKATFYYTAEGRVDFRELIRHFAREFHVKVEMRQIGARQEAGRIGGIGTCGRELCCSTWLTDFKSVTTSAARYQNLSINQSKLSGQCGRLKCCLNYELDTYMDALQDFPQKADKIDTVKGSAFLQKTDIFKKLMWYCYPDSNIYYPLSVDKVKHILSLNAKGTKADNLTPMVEEPKEMADEFTELVGHVNLSSLEKATRKKRKKKRKPGGGQSRRGDRRRDG